MQNSLMKMEGFYNKVISKRISRVRHAIKTPSWNFFVKIWTEQFEGKGWNIGNYQCILIENGMHFFPILIVKDAIGEEGTIPTVWLEDSYPELATAFLEGFNIDKVWLETQDGFNFSVLDLNTSKGPSQTIWRENKRVTATKMIFNFNVLYPILVSLEKDYIEYWQKKNVDPFPFDHVVEWAEDLFQNCQVFALLVYQNRNYGVGIYTRESPEMLTLEAYMRQDIYGLGSNIVLEGIKLCKDSGIRYINLGPEFQTSKWKHEWNTTLFPHKSIRPTTSMEDVYLKAKQNGFRVHVSNIENASDGRSSGEMS